MSESDVESSEVTASACPMFQALAGKLHTVYSKLSNKLFSSFWKLVATHLNSFLLEEVILDSHFNVNGAKVLKKDIDKFLIPLFQAYTRLPNVYFSQIQEACLLLSTDQLNGKRPYEAITQKELRQFKIKHLTPEQATAVFRRRMDVAPSLM